MWSSDGEFLPNPNFRALIIEGDSKIMAKAEISPAQRMSPVLRYGLAVVSACIALAVALLLARYNFKNVADPLFLFAIAITSWLAGLRPAVLAVVLSGMANAYFSSSRFTVSRLHALMSRTL
jgi:K+-sensing histidine kinase KdpD